MKSNFAHLIGAAVSKLAPSAAQVGLLMIVAREATLPDVGRLALASAAAFLCGSLADAGFTTTLSVPSVYLDSNAPPMRATRRLRFATAAAGTGLYCMFWVAGLGSYDPAFLLLTPLPAALALSYGYAGVMNAAGRLRLEGTIAAFELISIVSLALALTRVGSGIVPELLALAAVRVAGAIARAIVVSRLPQSRTPKVWRVVSRQAAFIPAITAIVVQGQADLLILGFTRNFDLLAVYSPLMRAAYGILLVAEALSWALYPAANVEGSGAEMRGGAAVFTFGLITCIAALAFAVLAQPFLTIVLGRNVGGIQAAVVLFALVIIVRFFAAFREITIIQTGSQKRRIPILAVSAIVLSAGAYMGATMRSIGVLGASRLASEFALAAGYFWLSRELAVRRPPVRACD